VTVSGAPADRSSRLVARSEPIRVLGPDPRYVSRGGLKLTPALEHFAVDVRGARALDAGASTGGFTDCLLQRGAAQVIAVDVGHGQLDPRLREDDRVVVLERTNIRDVTPEALANALASALATGHDATGHGATGHGATGHDATGHDATERRDRHRSPAADLPDPDRSPRGDPPWVPVDVVTADLSFISLTKVIPSLLGPVIRQGGDAVLLVKPQFEAGRAEVARGKGVVRDPVTWLGALSSVACALVGAGAAIMGAMASPLTGPSGNREFFLHARAGGTVEAPDDLHEILRRAVDSVGVTSARTTAAPFTGPLTGS